MLFKNLAVSLLVCLIFGLLLHFGLSHLNTKHPMLLASGWVVLSSFISIVAIRFVFTSSANVCSNSQDGSIQFSWGDDEEPLEDLMVCLQLLSIIGINVAVIFFINFMVY